MFSKAFYLPKVGTIWRTTTIEQGNDGPTKFIARGTMEKYYLVVRKSSGKTHRWGAKEVSRAIGEGLAKQPEKFDTYFFENDKRPRWKVVAGPMGLEAISDSRNSKEFFDFLK